MAAPLGEARKMSAAHTLIGVTQGLGDTSQDERGMETVRVGKEEPKLPQVTRR